MEKRKVGRPKDSGEYGETIQLRASPDMRSKITKAAQAAGILNTEWIRQAINEKLSK